MARDGRAAGSGRLLAAVLALGAGLRVAAILTVGASPRLHGDEVDYVAAAASLARGDGYPGAVRAPGLPFFLAAVFRSFGESLVAARLAQVPLALATIAMVFDLVRPRFGARAAALSALVVALHPTLIHYTHFLWTETLVSTLLVACVWTLDRFDRTRGGGWLVACGTAFGALVLTREMFAPLAIAACAWAIAAAPCDGRDALRRALLLLLPAVLLVAPWTVRNHARLGRWVLVSTTHWMPMAQGNLLPADGSWLRPANGEDFLQRYKAIPGELEREDVAREVALGAIRTEQPWWLAKKLVRTTWMLFFPWSQFGRAPGVVARRRPASLRDRDGLLPARDRARRARALVGAVGASRVARRRADRLPVRGLRRRQRKSPLPGADAAAARDSGRPVPGRCARARPARPAYGGRRALSAGVRVGRRHLGAAPRPATDGTRGRLIRARRRRRGRAGPGRPAGA